MAHTLMLDPQAHFTTEAENADYEDDLAEMEAEAIAAEARWKADQAAQKAVAEAAKGDEWTEDSSVSYGGTP